MAIILSSIQIVVHFYVVFLFLLTYPIKYRLIFVFFIKVSLQIDEISVSLLSISSVSIRLIVQIP